MFQKTRIRCVLVIGLAVTTNSVTAKEWWESNIHSRKTHSDFGAVGLMQTPTARMDADGEFSFSYYDSEEYRRMALNLQLFPWLETTIRYNDIRTRLFSDSPGFSNDQTYKDRGVDVKARLVEESYWLPELSVGLRDLAGTGMFAGEFIVASKRVGAFDFTLGMGWGYLGKRGNVGNPFCEVVDTFCQRGSGTTDTGGNFEVDKWFRGDAAIFGGVEYQTPWPELILKLEYDANNYRNEPALVPVEQSSPWNIGADYAINDALQLKLSYERGNTLMFGFTLRTNFMTLGQIKPHKPKVAPKPPTQESVDEFANTESATALAEQLWQESGISARRMQLTENNQILQIFGHQARYRDSNEGIDRAARILINQTPEPVKAFEFIDARDSMLLKTTRVERSVFRTAVERQQFDTEVEDSYSQFDPNLGDWNNTQPFHMPDYPLSWSGVSLTPVLEQSFGNPETFYMYQLKLLASSRLSLGNNTFLKGTIGANLLTNFDEFNFTVDAFESPLPRVRTYIREYVEQSDIWLDDLQLSHIRQLSNDWYASVYGGYLERMYGGVGGEILYRPFNKSYAIGIDINAVKQRSFESHLGFRDYETITGHITGYWKPEFLPDTLLRVSAGRFLAKDNGVQLGFEHKFDSGMIVGAFASKTNVSAEEYGEGSFTKGFYISIPFDLMMLNHTPGRGAVSWTPITRDGGQMLHRSIWLYNATESRNPFY